MNQKHPKGKPGHKGSKSVPSQKNEHQQDEAKPTENIRFLSVDLDRPVNNDAEPENNDTKPENNDTKPVKDDAKSDEDYAIFEDIISLLYYELANSEKDVATFEEVINFLFNSLANSEKDDTTSDED
ncbi:hypothetical protein EV182_007355, partial [Spiromyces aspiralis]